MPNKTKPQYNLHEARYVDRRTREDIYAGWFTQNDYESGFEEIKTLLETSTAPKSGKLLDLGCGAGNYSQRLAGLGYAVTGIDISPTAIEWAKENSPLGETQFICGDGVQLKDFQEDQFDFVFDGHFVHCIIGDDRKCLFSNVNNILKPDGFFLVRSIVWPATSTSDIQVDPKTKIGYLNGTPYRQYPTLEDLIEELETAGFIILKAEYTVIADDGLGFQHAVIQCTPNSQSHK